MAIEDGIVVRAQPLPSATTLIDTISGNPYTGTATTAATTISGEDAVKVSGGDLSGALLVPFTINTPTGEGATQLIRYKLNSLPAGSFDRLFLINDTVGASSRALNITNAGGDLRARVNDTQSSVTVTGSGTLGVTFTIVQVRENLAATDENRVWIKQSPAQPNRAPDFLDTGDNHAARTVGVIELLMGTGADVEILDHIVWNRPLTQIEASDVADDVRAQLPVQGGGSVPAGITTVGAITTTETTAEVNYSYNDTDETGFKYRLDGGSLVDVALVNPFTITGLTQGTAYAVEVLAYNATGDGTLSTPATNFTTDAAVIASITAELKNNTGQLLINETGITADVYNPVNGVLVVRKTGLTSDGSGVVTFSDALMSPVTGYNVVIELTSIPDLPGAERIISV